MSELYKELGRELPESKKNTLEHMREFFTHGYGDITIHIREQKITKIDKHETIK